jgi:hypothetical protein
MASVLASWLADRFGEVAYLAWVDGHDRESSAADRLQL